MVRTTMPNVIFSMGVSLDGFIADRDGAIDFSDPDEDLHRFHNEQTGELSAHLCGRRLYETMRYWDTAGQDPALGEVEREFAAIWQALPKVVFSGTLERVEGNARLATGSLDDELSALEGDVGIGGAGLAASAFERGLVDDVRMFVNPVVLGGGTPFFPPLEQRQAFELVQTRTFGSTAVLLRYRRCAG
jgi:dihydrofolate reductase